MKLDSLLKLVLLNSVANRGATFMGSFKKTKKKRRDADNCISTRSNLFRKLASNLLRRKRRTRFKGTETAGKIFAVSFFPVLADIQTLVFSR
jgi:hypothetical protein